VCDIRYLEDRAQGRDTEFVLLVVAIHDGLHVSFFLFPVIWFLCVFEDTVEV